MTHSALLERASERATTANRPWRSFGTRTIRAAIASSAVLVLLSGCEGPWTEMAHKNEVILSNERAVISDLIQQVSQRRSRMTPSQALNIFAEEWENRLDAGTPAIARDTHHTSLAIVRDVSETGYTYISKVGFSDVTDVIAVYPISVGFGYRVRERKIVVVIRHKATALSQTLEFDIFGDTARDHTADILASIMVLAKNARLIVDTPCPFEYQIVPPKECTSQAVLGPASK